MSTDTKKQTKKTHTIDASGKSLGRVASEAARVLMGKDEAHYTPHIGGKTHVTIENAEALAIPEKKLDAKQYKRYSGWPGGLKHESLRSLWKRRGIAEVIGRAVYGMMPANKLRKERMKRLTVK